MILSVLRRRGCFSFTFIRFFTESRSRSLRTEAIGETSYSYWREGVEIRSLLSPWKQFCATSQWGQRSKSRSSSSSSSDSDSEAKEEFGPRVDIAMLLHSMNGHQFQEHLEKLSDTQPQITYKELLNIAIKTGAAMTKSESHELCKAMFTSGRLFRCGEKVFLKPNDVADGVQNVLDSFTDGEKGIKELKIEFESLDKKKKKLESSTASCHKKILIGGFVFLVLQLLGICWMTFSVYSWDVVEPFTYLLALFYGILFYGYRWRYEQEFGHSALREQVKNFWREQEKETLDCDRHQILKKKIEAYDKLKKNLNQQ